MSLYTSRQAELNAPPGKPRFARMLEGIAMVLVAVSAILFQRSATSSWAEAVSATGHRVLVSPIGIQDWGPDSAIRPISECRWWPTLGDAALCELAAGGNDDLAKVRRAYPLTFVALWVSVLALFLVALRIPRQLPSAGIVVTAAVPVIATYALWQFSSGFRNAFVALQNAQTTVVPMGFGVMFLGALLMAIAVGLLITSRVLKRT
jgi:hypothetical protein